MNLGIEIENLSFAYESNTVLDDVSLFIQPGENVGISGISGGGKSTLLKLVSGLYHVQTGRISVMGATDDAGRRKNVAMVMQSPSLFPASILDNITCGHIMSDAEIHRACDAAQLSEWIAALPDGLQTFVGERGGKVSGGQAQRIAVARAIAKNAPVILLDEPASALDRETSAALMAALKVLIRGKTVLHVSHQPDTLAMCDRFLRLEGGRLYVL